MSDLSCFIEKLNANKTEDTQFKDHPVIINFTRFEVNTIDFLPSYKEYFFKVTLDITNNN